MQYKKFRHDINGLRAIAVIAVVLFHFNSSWMPGGFAGVDVFFVISGFLMTGIIFKGIEENNFSVLKFYIARANRIIPALATLCFVLLIFGWFYLTPLDYEALAKHTAGSMTFLSNIIYLREVGYFDVDSHEKWLLHTWSLSVEWQFYIIYPLAIIILRRLISLSSIKKIILLGTILGMIFCIIGSYKWPSASYYLLPMRTWEMMIGGLAYLYPFKLQTTNKKILESIGLILIIGSYFLISSDNLWPGYLAICPTLGAFLIIQANLNNSIITNNIIFQKIGSWSYSIYLWHWPLVVCIYVFALNKSYIFLGIPLSVFLGYLSYKYIEKINFRENNTDTSSYLRFKLFYITLILTSISLLIYYSNGKNWWDKTKSTDTINTYNIILKNTVDNKNWHAGIGGKQDFSYCRFNTQDLTLEVQNRIKKCAHIYGPGYLVLGDSHAEDLFGMITFKFKNNFIVGLTSTKKCRPHTPQKGCQYNDLNNFISTNKNVFKHIFYEQAGFYLMLNGKNKGSREMFNRLDLTENVENISLDKEHIQKVLEYLNTLSKHTNVTWFGSKVEPHINSRQIMKMGCNYNYHLRPNQRELFDLLDNEIKKNIKQKSNLSFISQNKILRFDFSKDLINCKYYLWEDGDHLSKLGEKTFSDRLPNNLLDLDN